VHAPGPRWCLSGRRPPGVAALTRLRAAWGGGVRLTDEPSLLPAPYVHPRHYVYRSAWTCAEGYRILRFYEPPHQAGSCRHQPGGARAADGGPRLRFSQATIWKIERGQRPVKASELIALADSLRVMTAASLTRQPDAARHQVQLDQALRKAQDAYQALKKAAASYLDAQVELAVMARLAQDAGLAATELHTSWLDTPPEEAVIEARMEADQEAPALSRSTTRLTRSWTCCAAVAATRPCASKMSRYTALSDYLGEHRTG